MPSRKSNNKPKPDNTPVPVHDWSFEAIGTRWWIGLYEAAEASALQKAQRLVAERIKTFDKTYSRFRSDSIASAVSRMAGDYELPPDSQALFALYRKLYDATGGVFTPLVGQLLSDAGYDASYSLQPGDLTVPPRWDDVISYRDSTLHAEKPVLLDFGAAGKGYLADLVAAELQAAGFTKFCVDAGGDMVCSGLSDPLKIGLEHPDDPSQVVGVAELQHGALCGSAGNRRAWAEYHHIMNPFTLDSPRDIKAVWATADNALTADGLTTALFFVDPAKLLQQFRFAYAIMYADGSVVVSSDFPAQLLTITRENT